MGTTIVTHNSQYQKANNGAFSGMARALYGPWPFGSQII